MPGDTSRRIVADAWVWRRKVELAAQIRFARFAQRLDAIGAPKVIVQLAARASRDEAKHAGYCTELALAYGFPANQLETTITVGNAAPGALPARERLIYELVAACCIAESESMATLTTLLDRVVDPRLKAILRELAADEVHHSRLGWAYLSFERQRGSLAFLGELLPWMLSKVVAPKLFEGRSPDHESPELIEHGVLTDTLRRDVFEQALKGVVFPGLAFAGVDVSAGERWLTERLAGGADPSTRPPVNVNVLMARPPPTA
jgi:hypothetical protein